MHIHVLRCYVHVCNELILIIYCRFRGGMSSLVLVVPNSYRLVQRTGGNDGLPDTHVHTSDLPVVV